MKDSEIETLNLEGWPLPNEYLLELGRVSAIWNALESLLNLCLAKLAGFNDLNDRKPFILVNHSSFPQRLDMLGALCEMLNQDFPNLKDYKGTISNLRSAQKERNKFVHGKIFPDEQTGEVYIAAGSARGHVKTEVKKISIADIRRSAIAISDAQRDLYKLILGQDIPPPWASRDRR